MIRKKPVESNTNWWMKIMLIWNLLFWQADCRVNKDLLPEQVIALGYCRNGEAQTLVAMTDYDKVETISKILSKTATTCLRFTNF